LVSSTPKDGGKLPESGVIELSFNEKISPMSRSFRLNNYAPDSSISSVEVDVSYKSDSVLVVSPKTPLQPGTWSLLWQVESADGHPVAGVLRFSAGDVQLSLPPVPVVSDNSNIQDRVLESSSWLIAPLLLASMLLSRRRLMYVSSGLLFFTTFLRLLGFYDKFSWSMFDSGEAKSTLALGIGSLVPFLDNLSKKTPAPKTNYFKKYAALLSLVSSPHKDSSPDTTGLQELSHPLPNLYTLPQRFVGPQLCV
jgi:methionine-rich copper-binding protein CopC